MSGTELNKIMFSPHAMQRIKRSSCNDSAFPIRAAKIMTFFSTNAKYRRPRQMSDHRVEADLIQTALKGRDDLKNIVPRLTKVKDIYPLRETTRPEPSSSRGTRCA